MITEDYVSFEVAKRLKEKGFKGQGEHFYEDNKITNYINYWFRITPEQRYEAIEAPTLQMAMKWLREKHNLVIQIELIDFLEHGEVWFYCITERKTIKLLTDRDEDFTEHSYEEAVEAAIKYCLENLI